MIWIDYTLQLRDRSKREVLAAATILDPSRYIIRFLLFANLFCMNWLYVVLHLFGCCRSCLGFVVSIIMSSEVQLHVSVS